MRVIRTELFFSGVRDVGNGASRAAKENPGIGIAFFGGESRPQLSLNFLLSSSLRVSHDDEATIERFLDLSLRGVEYSFRFPHSKYLRENVRNRDEVRFLFEANIVVEESPPHWEIFKTLVTKSPGVAIGTYAGIELAGSNPELMIVTIPMGIMAVSSAIGISKALERGLNKKVEQLLDRTRRRG